MNKKSVLQKKWNCQLFPPPKRPRISPKWSKSKIFWYQCTCISIGVFSILHAEILYIGIKSFGFWSFWRNCWPVLGQKLRLFCPLYKRLTICPYHHRKCLGLEWSEHTQLFQHHPPRKRLITIYVMLCYLCYLKSLT